MARASIHDEELARQIHELQVKVVRLQNMVEGIIKHGAVTDVDTGTQRVRIQIGTEPDEKDKDKEKKKPQKSGWVPYGLGFAGEFSQIWHPSIGQNMTLVSPHGDKAQSVAYPFTFSKKYPAPSDNPNCHILCNFGSSRIEIWKEQIVIISDNIHLTALKGDITETADRHIEMETHDLKKKTKVVRNKPEDDKEQKTPDKLSSIISQVTGSPDKDHGDSVISQTAGSPERGTSAITAICRDLISEACLGTIMESARDLISETCATDITNTAKRYIKIETQDHEDGSKISLKTGGPEHADSTITLQTGDPGAGTSAIAIQTGKPTTGDTLIAINVVPPILGSCQYDLISGGSITEMAATDVTTMAGLNMTRSVGLDYNLSLGNNKTDMIGLNWQVTTGLKVDVFAGAPVEFHAPEIALLGHSDVGGYGGPAIARVGDRVDVNVLTGIGSITTGAGNSNAV